MSQTINLEEESENNYPNANSKRTHLGFALFKNKDLLNSQVNSLNTEIITLGTGVNELVEETLFDIPKAHKKIKSIKIKYKTESVHIYLDEKTEQKKLIISTWRPGG